MAYASAVALTPVDITRDGKSLSKTPVTPTATHGNKFPNDGKTFLYVENGSVSDITVTIDVNKQTDGLELPDKVITVKATGDANGLDKQLIGPFSQTFNQADGYVWAVCSAVTTVKIGCFRI